MRWSDSITNSMDMNLSKIREIVEDRGTWHAAVNQWGHKELDRTYRMKDNMLRKLLSL